MDTPTAQARRIEYLALDDLPPAARNPKGHNRRAIRSSIERFGFVGPAVIDERTGRLVAGHGRTEVLKLMRDGGASPPQGVRLADDGGWLVPVLHGWESRSDTEAEAFLVADNQLTVSGGWDPDGLGEILRDLGQLDPSLLPAVGFSDEALEAVLAGDEYDFSRDFGHESDEHGAGQAGDDPEPDGGEEAGTGALLELAGTTIGDPDYKVERLDVWRMGPRLTLVVANPHTEWQTFVPLLSGDMLFMPYPSPMAALADGAKDRDVLFVQPNKFLAGWLLTKWARVTGGHPTKADS